MNYEKDLVEGLVNDLLNTVHKYDETLLVSTVIGCLEIVKADLLSKEEDDDN